MNSLYSNFQPTYPLKNAGWKLEDFRHSFPFERNSQPFRVDFARNFRFIPWVVQIQMAQLMTHDLGIPGWWFLFFVYRSSSLKLGEMIQFDFCIFFFRWVRSKPSTRYYTITRYSGQIITTKPPVGHLKWWFSKGIPKSIPETFRFRNYTNLPRDILLMEEIRLTSWGW